MAGFNDQDILLMDYMLKRSIMKGRFKMMNFKNRWFILKSKFLIYCDGEASPNNEKGRIILTDIKTVECVDEEALGGKPNAFQIVYRQSNLSMEMYTLYIIGTHREQRTRWIDELRKACNELGVVFSKKYHPGVWTTKTRRYTCCDSINKADQGCQASTASANVNANVKTREQNGSEEVVSTSMSVRPLPAQPAQEQEIKKRVLALYDYTKGQSDDLSLVKGEEYRVLDDSNQYWWLALNKHGDKGHIPANFVEELTNEGLESYDAGTIFQILTSKDGPHAESVLNAYLCDTFMFPVRGSTLDVRICLLKLITTLQGWFYRNCTREQAAEILMKEAVEGCFLVRESSSRGMYSLSLYTKEKYNNQAADGSRPDGFVRHYHIKTNSEGKFYLSEKHPTEKMSDLIFYHKHNCAGLVVRLRSPPSDRSSSKPTASGLGHNIFEINPQELVFGEVLGTGQFGMVKKARWQGKADVAVKMMNAGMMSELDFIDEAKTMKQLTHPHLVQLYGVTTKVRPIYIITEYMKNGSLLHYLKKYSSRLLKQPGTLVDMCCQVSDAMQYLESKKFLHRDLAARNCLVGENNIIKVGDFGLARFVLDDEYTSSSGTRFPIKWAPPEVLSYTKFSSKSDIWAYGVLMWEVFTCGEMPYGRMRNPDVVDLVCHRGERLQRPPVCPENVYHVMYSCWHQHPEKRPAFIDIFRDISTIMDEQHRDYAQ